MKITERSSLVDYRTSALSISLEHESVESRSQYNASLRRLLVYIYADKITKEQFLLAISVICLMIATAGERGKRSSAHIFVYVSICFISLIGHPPDFGTSYHGIGESTNLAIQISNSNLLKLLYSVYLLVTFKMAVDRMVPYRFVLIQLIFIASVLIYSAISYLKQGYTNKITKNMKDFPHSKLLIMAALDTIQFAGLTVSAAGVSPAMTVILLHTSTPFLVLGSRFSFPDRKYSLVQMRGVQLIALAVLISLIGSLSYFISPGVHESDTASSFVYFCMAALHGFATLYKEQSIIAWSQPMDIHFLSSWLFFYQFIVALILSPLIYLLQGISSDWQGFPMDTFFDNISDGLICFMGQNPENFTRYDSAYATCSCSSLLVLGYVISNVIVLECIGKVLQSNNLILARSMAAAVFVSFLALGIYDTKLGYQHGLFGSAIDISDIIAIIILLFGMEVYGHDPEPDVEAVTNFSP